MGRGVCGGNVETTYRQRSHRDRQGVTARLQGQKPLSGRASVRVSSCRMGWPQLRLLPLVAFTLACGGAKPKGEHSSTPDESGSSGLETGETRCLAIARGTRERQGNEPDKITVKHILVKFAGSKNARPEIKRTQGDACVRALEARTRLQAGETFAAVVAEYSDEPGAATREGSLGTVKRSDVVPAFANAAFELKPDEVSHVVETEFGYHIIMRTQ
jgi:peptidyl-prolyl cis-trans isomerase NIMA-interacting 1